jgi:amino acid permease
VPRHPGRNSRYFFAGQLAGAHAVQYPVRLGLLQHILLLLSEITSLTLHMDEAKKSGPLPRTSWLSAFCIFVAAFLLVSDTERSRFTSIRISLKRIVLCFNVSTGIFTIAIPRMGATMRRRQKYFPLVIERVPGFKKNMVS